MKKMEDNMVYIIDKYSRLIYKIAHDRLKNPVFVDEALQEVLLAIYKSKDKVFSLSEEE